MRDSPGWDRRMIYSNLKIFGPTIHQMRSRREKFLLTHLGFVFILPKAIHDQVPILRPFLCDVLLLYLGTSIFQLFQMKMLKCDLHSSLTPEIFGLNNQKHLTFHNKIKIIEAQS